MTDYRWLVRVKDDSGDHITSVIGPDAACAAKDAADWDGRPVTDVLSVERAGYH